MVIPTGFDWHLLIGDDTALPAIGRRLAELPRGARVAAVIEVGDPSARIEFDTQADLYIEWRYRSEAAYRGSALLQAVGEFTGTRADEFSRFAERYVRHRIDLILQHPAWYREQWDCQYREFALQEAERLRALLMP